MFLVSVFMQNTQQQQPALEFKTMSDVTRVTRAQIEAAAAAYPAAPQSGVRNVFGGRVGASRASVYDYALVATPGCYWAPVDLATLYCLLERRGLSASGKGKAYAMLEGFGPDSTPLAVVNGKPIANPLKAYTAYNNQHTTEFTTADINNGWTGPDGKRYAWVVAAPQGGWMLNPGFVAYCAASGIKLQMGYPTLPEGGFPAEQPAAAPAAATAKVAAAGRKASGKKPSAK